MEGIDSCKGKERKGLILKTWERCRSIGGTSPKRSPYWSRSPKSPNEDTRKTKRRVTPEGCFSVYVGPEKQRFVIKTVCINHPLFKMLLEEAESEYGYNNEGPLMLPCDVDLFCKVLAEMDGDGIVHQGCNFAKGYGSSYSLLSPSRMVSMDRI
ncbi:hypothetical protein GIB67_009430 [Kingdonia uniflora]|uniref:Uncharacterized protein n=1 Tax=Kingdonia uniflora TaxID=39325 RepID=A0A7J7N2W2_9MAGN|nr:hypothetical protein GIB67_009430 [Kingdonia uniflora]